MHEERPASDVGVGGERSPAKDVIKLMPQLYVFFPDSSSPSVAGAVAVCLRVQWAIKASSKARLRNNEAIRRQWHGSQLSGGINHIRPYSGRHAIEALSRLLAKGNAIVGEFSREGIENTYTAHMAGISLILNSKIPKKSSVETVPSATSFTLFIYFLCKIGAVRLRETFWGNYN